MDFFSFFRKDLFFWNILPISNMYICMGRGEGEGDDSKEREATKGKELDLAVPESRLTLSF